MFLFKTKTLPSNKSNTGLCILYCFFSFSHASFWNKNKRGLFCIPLFCSNSG